MEVRIVFTSEVYIEGDNLNEIREKWESLDLYNKGTDVEYIEMVSSERVDDESYADVNLYNYDEWAM